MLDNCIYQFSVSLLFSVTFHLRRGEKQASNFDNPSSNCKACDWISVVSGLEMQGERKEKDITEVLTNQLPQENALPKSYSFKSTRFSLMENCSNWFCLKIYSHI